MIDSIVYSFVKSGYFRPDEHSDVKQQVNEGLLKRAPNMQQQFNGETAVSTYLFTIIRNICYEIIRKNKRTAFVSFNEIVVPETRHETIYELVFADEMLRLKKALRLYFGQEPKIILCLKLKFRLFFTINDFKKVYENMSDADFHRFSQKYILIRIIRMYRFLQH